MHFLDSFRPNKGFAVLMSVIITAAIGLAISVSLLLLGLGATKSSLALEQSAQAKALANACAESALEALRQNSSYSGNQNLNFTVGSCTIFSVLGSGNTDRTVQAQGTSGTVVRKVEVEISSISPQMQITTWQEVADF